MRWWDQPLFVAVRLLIYNHLLDFDQQSQWREATFTINLFEILLRASFACIHFTKPDGRNDREGSRLFFKIGQIVSNSCILCKSRGQPTDCIHSQETRSIYKMPSIY